MAVTYGFYNSVNGDRKYDALQMSSLFDGVIKDGVFISVGENLMVTPGTGLDVNVASGRAWFNHTWTNNDSTIVLTHDAADPLYKRIDAVVLEVDATEEVRANTIKIIKGVPASSPVRPTLTNTTTVHQYPLAYVDILAAVTQLLASHITIMVGSTSCPFVTGVVTSMNIDTLVARWESEFNQWFDNIKGQLSEDPAGNLQNQIDDLVTQDGVQNTINVNVQNELDAITALGSASGSGWVSTPDNWDIDYHSVGAGLDYVGYPESIPAGNNGLRWPAGTKIKYHQPHAFAAHFPFNGNSNPAVGVFTPANIGTPEYATVNWTINGDPYSTQALLLKGAQGIAVGGTLTPFKPTYDFSISFGLMKHLPLQLFTGTIFQSGTWETKYGINVYFDGEGYLVFSVGNGSAAYTVKTSQPSDWWTVSNTFYHFVCTFRHGRMCLYKDGVLEAEYDTGISQVGYHPTEHYVRFGCMVAATGGATHTSYTGGSGNYTYLDEFYFLNDVAINLDTILDMYDLIYWTPFGNGPLTVTKYAITSLPQYNKYQTDIYSGRDYQLITGPGLTLPKLWYSVAKAPIGFPTDPDAWAFKITDSARVAQASPVNGTWYALKELVWPSSFPDWGNMMTYPLRWNITLDLVVSIAGAATGTEVVVGIFKSWGGADVLIKSQTVFFPLSSYRVPIHIEIPYCDCLPISVKAKVTNANVTSVAFENVISPLVIRADCPYI